MFIVLPHLNQFGCSHSNLFFTKHHVLLRLHSVYIGKMINSLHSVICTANSFQVINVTIQRLQFLTIYCINLLVLILFSLYFNCNISLSPSNLSNSTCNVMMPSNTDEPTFDAKGSEDLRSSVPNGVKVGAPLCSNFYAVRDRGP